jgi:uncharacterized protein
MLVPLAMFVAFAGPTPQKDAVTVDCTHSQSITETTICRNPVLIQMDARLGAYYQIATQFVAMGERGNLGDSMDSFPARRNKCGSNIACITNAYEQQMAPLQAIIDRVKSHGPF